MNRWFKRILYFLCILEIGSANPTRAPDIIKGDEEVKFQNKLPEETLDSENTVVGKPLDTTTHRIGQLGNNQSLFRENEKNHCPFCQYAANRHGSSIETQDQDSESTQPYLIIGNIKPVAGETNIITEEDSPIDNNSTWNPQNEIKAILKIPDGSSSNNGKEYKRCTHTDHILGGSLQKTELDSNLLNNPDALNNIDFSCCSTLRRILLNALKLEGKCLCSEHRATSPIINITALKDNGFEEGIIRQEFPPMIISQQQNMTSKILNQEEVAGNSLLREGDTKTIKHNEEKQTGEQDKEYNITNLGGGIQKLTNLDRFEVTLNSTANTPLITDGKIEESNANDESNIDVTPIIKSGNQLVANGSLNKESRTQSKPSSEGKKEHVINDSTNKVSSVNTSGTGVPSATGENSVNSSTEPNEKLEQIEEYPSNNGTLGLFVGQGFDNNNELTVKEELNGKNGNEEKKYNFNEDTNDYTTESGSFFIEIEKPSSANSADNLLKMNMQLSDGTTESIQDSTQNMETQTLKPRPTDNESDITSAEEANHTDGNLLKVAEIDHDILQLKTETQSVGNETLSHESEEVFLRGAENRSNTAVIEDRNNPQTTSYTEDWSAVNLISTMAYDLGQKLELGNTLLEKTEPQHDMNSFIASTTELYLISTSGKNDLNETKYQNIDSQGTPNSYSHSLNEGSETPQIQDGGGNLLQEIHATESIMQQTQFEDQLFDDQISKINEEIPVEISSTDSPEYSTYLPSLPRQILFNNKSISQLNSSTEIVLGNQVTETSTNITSNDSIPSFGVNSLTTDSTLQETRNSTPRFEMNSRTTESTLQETRNSTPGFEMNLLTTESTLQETKSTEVLMEDEMPIISTETSNINSSDFLIHHQQSSSQDYLLGTESSQPIDSLLEATILNITSEKPSDIKLSDPIENKQQLLLGETEKINNQSHNDQNIPPDRLEPDNYILGSNLTVSTQKQPTDSPLEAEILNLTMKSEILSRTMKGEISNLTTGSPSDIKLNTPIENNQPEETEKIDYRSKNGQGIISGDLEPDGPSKNEQGIIAGDLEPDNYMLGSIQTSGVESGTLPNDLVSTLAANYLDMDIGTVATTPLETNLLSQFVGDKTKQNQVNMLPSTEPITSELLLATDKIDVNEVQKEENSTGVDLEMEKAEDILKSLIDGFKKTHMVETSNDSRITDKTELALLETSTYDPPLENINVLKSSDKPKDVDEDPINVETNTDKSENIGQYPNFFEFDSPNNDVNFILQNEKISSTSIDEELLKSTTMINNITATTMGNNTKATKISNNITATTMGSDNITEIQNSSEMNTTSSSRINLVDYDKYLAEINELHKFSTDNESTLIESLEGSSSTLPPDFNSRIISTNEESSLSIIELFTPRPIDDIELTLVSHNTESTSNESELERASDEGVRQDPQEISSPNFVSLISKEFETATLDTKNQENAFNSLDNFSKETTRHLDWNNVTPEISDTSPNIKQSTFSKDEPPVNQLNSTDLEEEILSTGNYQVHHVNVSKYDGYKDLNNNVKETSTSNLNSNNMMLEELETSTMISKHHQENNNNDLGFSYLTSNLSEDSIESTTIELIKSDNENTDLAQILTPTEFEIHSPVIVCLPEQDSHHLNNDYLLGSRFFIQNEANTIEFELVQRNVSLCGCPHNSYELKPKSRVSKADMNLLKSLEGQHISKILRREHKTNDNYETTTENDNVLKIHLDSHEKKIGMSSITSDKAEHNEDIENQELGNKHVGDYRESEKLKEKHSCNCQCLGNVDSPRAVLEKRGETKNLEGKYIDQGQDGHLKSQIKNSKSENIMRLDKDRNDYKEGTNYKSKSNRGRQQSSRRRDFPIMVDKDILKRFISVYRPHNYFRRS